MGRYDQDVLDRFWSKVRKSEETDGCWLWTASLHTEGYGHFGLRGRIVRAHRVSWEIANGVTVPDGMKLCHTCDNPPCVRPDHLFIGTDAENAKDKVRKGRSPRGEEAPKVRLTNDSVQRIVELRRQGVPRKDVARLSDIDPSVITRIMSGQIWSHITGIVDGEQEAHSGGGHRWAKLTDQQAEEVYLTRTIQKRSLRDIAAEFGIQESTVSRIANGVRRKRAAEAA